MKKFEHGYALLIGVDENKVKEWALEGVKKDILELEKVLLDTERCAYPERNVKTILGPEAEKDGIMKGLEWLKGCVEDDPNDEATAIIYFSGHGWRNDDSEIPEYYLIPYDVDKGKNDLNGILADDFAGVITEIDPRRLLVLLDCCHAGGMGVKDVRMTPKGFSEEAISHQPFLEEAKKEVTDGLKKGKGRAVINSSTGIQKSYMRKEGDMSIFIFHLIEALTGHAQPLSGAREVLVTDVMSYVTRHVPETAAKEWNQVQEPLPRAEGNFPIALLLGGEGISLVNKTDDAIKVGMEHLEVQDYESAMQSFQKAQKLKPANEKVKVLYFLSYLSGKPIRSIENPKMNRVTLSLKKIVNGNDLEASHLARLVLGIIWYDYYVVIDHNYQEVFFKNNVRYLGNYKPSFKERDLVNHIECSQNAKYMFNLH